MTGLPIEEQLKRTNAERTQTELPSIVRTRLNETYARLSSLPREKRRPKASPLRRTLMATAAAGILGVGVFASAFVSPTMASALKSLPLVGSVFSTIESDLGLRLAGDLGMTSNVNRTVSHEDVNLVVTETFYDGVRAAFLLDVSAPNLEEGIYDNGRKTMKLSSAVDNVFLTIDGAQEDGALFYGGAGEGHPNTLVFEKILTPSEVSAAADTFSAKVTMTLDGIEHDFVVDIPFTKAALSTIEVSPDAVAADETYSFTVSKAEVTPVTTRLQTSIALTGAASLTRNEERQLQRVGIAVFDDQGQRLPALNGEGVYEGNRLIYDRRFASTPGASESEYLIVKPFVIQDDFAEDVKEDQFLPGLETRIQLPASP